MKFLIVSFITVIFSLLVFSPVALAYSAIPICSGTQSASTTSVCSSVQAQVNKGKTNNPVLVIMKVAINILSYIIGIAAVIVLIIGGLQMVFGSSDPQAVAKARSTMMYAVVGVVVAALAQVLVLFVLKNIS